MSNVGRIVSKVPLLSALFLPYLQSHFREIIQGGITELIYQWIGLGSFSISGGLKLLYTHKGDVFVWHS